MKQDDHSASGIGLCHGAEHPDPPQAAPAHDPREAAQAFCVLDAAGSILHASPQACRLLGRGLDDLRLSSPFSNLQASGPAGESTPLSKILAGEIGRCHVILNVAHDGREAAPLRVHLSLAHGNGAGNLVLAILSDPGQTRPETPDTPDTAADQPAGSPAPPWGDSPFRDVFVMHGAVMLLVDADEMRIVDCNESALRYYGFPRETLVAMALRDLEADPAGEPGQAADTKRRAGCPPSARHRRADGTVRDVELLSSKVRHPGRNLQCCIVQDVTERRQAERLLQRSERRFRSIFERSTMGIAIIDLDGNIMDMNRAGLAIIGYSLDEVRSMHFTDYNHPEDAARTRTYFDEIREGRRDFFELTKCYVRKDGEPVWGRQTVTLVRNEAGEPRYAISMLEDITDHKKADDMLRHLAFHDALTGLANRALFLDRLGGAIRRRKRNPESNFSVLFLDLDRFKLVNDSLGHPTGDTLLCEIAARLTECIRASDTLARFGGDEFAILLDDLHDPLETLRVIERIRRSLSSPFLLDGHEIFAGASIGVVLGTERYERPEEIMRDADIAMYRAKENGNAGYEIFDSRMHDQARHVLRLETDLRKALERGEFELYFQPIVSLRTNRITGIEALVRWNHPTRGLVGPGEFIPLAEEAGLIFDLDRWVLASACSIMDLWSERYPAARDLLLNVNLSAKYFLKRDAVDDFSEILRVTGVQPSRLRLEITENLILDGDEHVTGKLLKLRAMGVSLALDDFGTGYSSLSYLVRFPFDALKIDRGFIIGMLDKPGDMAIVQSVLTLGKNLGLEVVAEGVETLEHAARLSEFGCIFAQGYFYYRPMPAGDFTGLLSKPAGLAVTY